MVSRHPGRKSRLELTLAPKVSVIRFLYRGASLQEAADKFCISKSQAGRIKQLRSQLLDDIESESSPLSRRSAKPKHPEIDGQVPDFRFVRSQRLPVSMV